MGFFDFFRRIFNKKDKDTVVNKEVVENKEVENNVNKKADTTGENTNKDESKTIEEIVDELNKEQKAINALYKKVGLTDEVLERQVALNTRRSEYDIPDDSQLVEGWSQ